MKIGTKLWLFNVGPIVVAALVGTVMFGAATEQSHRRSLESRADSLGRLVARGRARRRRPRGRHCAAARVG